MLPAIVKTKRVLWEERNRVITLDVYKKLTSQLEDNMHNHWITSASQAAERLSQFQS